MVWYNNGKGLFLDPRLGSIGEPPFEIKLDVIVVGLMKTSYSIDIDSHVNYGDISASGVVASNYTEPGNSGSHALAGVDVAVDNTNDRGEVDATDKVLTTLGNGTNDTFDQIVIAREQDSGATEGNTRLLAHTGVGATLTNGGNITLVFDGEGLLHLA